MHKMIAVALDIMLVFFQAEDGIRDLVRSRGLGDVYKRQVKHRVHLGAPLPFNVRHADQTLLLARGQQVESSDCLLYTSDAADEQSSVDLGGRRIIKKKKHTPNQTTPSQLTHSILSR